MEDAETLTRRPTIPPIYTHESNGRTFKLNKLNDHGDYLNVAIDREHMDCDREGLGGRRTVAGINLEGEGLGGRRTVAGINLEGDEPRKLRDALNEYLGETPADPGTLTIKVDVYDAAALDRLNDLRRKIETLIALPPSVQWSPTITVTNHFPEPPADPAEAHAKFDPVLPPDAEFDNLPRDAEDDEPWRDDEECVDLAEDVLHGIRLAAGLDPSDDGAKLALLSRTTAERLGRLLRPNGVLLTLAEQLNAHGMDVPLIRSEDEREAYREIIETKAADIARERDLFDILRDAFADPQETQEPS